MTFQELYEYAQSQTDDIDGTVLGKIKTWINRAQEDVYTRSNWDFAQEHDAELDLVVNDDTYSLADDFKKIIGGGVRDSTNNRFIPVINYRDFVMAYPAVSTTNDIGTPEVAYFAGLDSTGLRQISFYPVPDSSITVKYDYFRNPTALTLDADVPELPAQHHLMLANYALWKYYESEENNTANYYKRLYEEDINKLLADNDFIESMGQMRMSTGKRYKDYSTWFYNQL